MLQNKSALRYSILILFVLFATSGFPSFMKFKAIVLPLLLPMLYFRIIKNAKCISRKTIIAIVILVAFGVIHFLIGDLTLVGTISFVLVSVTIIFAAIASGDFFREAYIRIMLFISYIALFIWILLLLVPSFYSTLLSIGNMLPQMMTDAWLNNTTNNGVSLYLYFLPNKFTSLGVIRNCGPFYEPGLFASYLVIALIFNFSKNHKLLSLNNIVLICTILTTFSSAGYVSLSIIILYAAFFSKSILHKFSVVLIALLLCQPMLQLDFISEKIQTNFDNATESSASRFGALIYHSEKIAEAPLIGYAGGELPVTKFDKYLGHASADRVLSPNGLSYSFVYWGIPLAICFYICLFIGIKQILPIEVKKWELCLIYIIILSAAFAQTITTEPILMLISALALIK